MKYQFKVSQIKPISIPGIIVGLAGLALTPLAQAVSPAPDEGYPGFNTGGGAKRPL